LSRLENLRRHVDHLLFQLDGDPCRDGFVHLYGVSLCAALLARRRGLDSDLAAAAGMLHDIWSYTSGNAFNHAEPSASLARRILAEVGGYGKDEIEQICTAIIHHSDKASVHSPLDEVLKDADVLQHYFYNPTLPENPGEKDRLARCTEELGITSEE
jgi:HD superfamily phosphodiesterase